jgi:3',5'-cyclic-AMP phosphodiesterase
MLVLHLSDVHVTDPTSAIARFADGEERLTGVVDHLIDAAVPLDAVVVTGDLVDHGTDDEYERVAALLGRLRCPWYVLPGNHDRRPAFDTALLTDSAPPPGNAPCNYAVDLAPAAGPPVRLVMVDSSRPDHHDGMWTAESLAWLDGALVDEPTVRTLVFTHHPPVSTGLWHMDYGGAHGGDLLAEVISRHPQVEVVACGHVHRRLTIRWAGTLLSCAPSLTYRSEALLAQGADPTLDDALPDLPVYRFIDGRFAVDSLDWHPGRTRIPMRLALGDEWPDYEIAARSGTLPRAATGH